MELIVTAKQIQLLLWLCLFLLLGFVNILVEATALLATENRLIKIFVQDLLNHRIGSSARGELKDWKHRTMPFTLISLTLSPQQFRHHLA